jgi:hypothetical protein
MSNIKSVFVTVQYQGGGKDRVIPLINTQEPEKNKTGNVRKSIWQPKPDDKFAQPYSKLYLDTTIKA